MRTTVAMKDKNFVFGMPSGSRSPFDMEDYELSIRLRESA
jgi:hypothetical protein